MKNRMPISTPDVFPKARLIDLDKHERAMFTAVKKDATKLIPRLNGNPMRQDGWGCVGCPAHWLSSKSGFDSFKTDISQRLRLQTRYHCWQRRNSQRGWTAENVAVTLMPRAKAMVIEAVRQELETSKDLETVLKRLQERNVPSESQKQFANAMMLEDFIRRNRGEVMPKPTKTVTV